LSLLLLTALGLDEVSDVHGHLVDAGVVEFLDVVQSAFVLVSHEVDGHAQAAETASMTNPEMFGFNFLAEFKFYAPIDDTL
jgi:hypothetical protein